jgi:hypothetical protein
MKDFKVAFTLSCRTGEEAEQLVQRMAMLASESDNPAYDNFNISLTDENGMFMVGEGRMRPSGGVWTGSTADEND